MLSFGAVGNGNYPSSPPSSEEIPSAKTMLQPWTGLQEERSRSAIWPRVIRPNRRGKSIAECWINLFPRLLQSSTGGWICNQSDLNLTAVRKLLKFKNMEKRMIHIGQLQPECIEEYRRHHRQVWPELEALYRQAGILQSSCFLHADRLLVFSEYDDEKYPAS